MGDKMDITEINVQTGEKTVREYTQEELGERATLAPTDLELWGNDMMLSDKIMPRWAEELVDYIANGVPLSQNTIDKMNEKKILRKSKPNVS